MTSRAGIPETHLIRERTSEDAGRAEGRRWHTSSVSVLIGLGLIMCMGFLMAPGSIGAKAHLALHGICAQRPSHSFWLGNSVLPLDARMTGIYLSAATTVVWLAALGRSRAAKVPGPAMLATLLLFVAIMGIDGVNGLLSDLGFWHLYDPTNITRLLTGLLAGASLGAGLAHVFALSMWAKPQPARAVVEQLSDVAPPILIAGCLGFVAVLGLPIAYDLLTVGLVGAALVVFWLPSMVVVALFSGRTWFATRYSELDRMAVAGLILAVVILAALAIFRSIAEQRLGLASLT